MEGKDEKHHHRHHLINFHIHIHIPHLHSHQQHHHHDHRAVNFHIHMPHLHFHHHRLRDVPKGCLAVMVGQEEDRLERFVVPVMYVSHPLFMHLLEEAENEYGFDHEGPITIPCRVEEFRHVQGVIDEERHLHHHHGALCC